VSIFTGTLSVAMKWIVDTRTHNLAFVTLTESGKSMWCGAADHLRRLRVTTEDGAHGQLVVRLRAQLAELPDILSALLIRDTDR
jgi:hypothetical protein